MFSPPIPLGPPPAGAASKPLLPPTKNQKVQFGALCLKMREPTLNEKSAVFLKLILSKVLENVNNATPPRLAFSGAPPQQNFLLQFSDFAPPFDFTASFLASPAVRRGEQTSASPHKKSRSPIWCPLFEKARPFFACPPKPEGRRRERN